MTQRRSIARAAALATFAAAAVAIPAAPALAGTPPSCIVTDVISFNVVTVHNRCGLTSYRIKVVWTAARDSGCFTIPPLSSRGINALNQPFAQYDKTVTC
jgi:hypothetical protein